MACLEHVCRACGHVWFNNDPSWTCIRCGSRDTVRHFDEPPELDHEPEEDYEHD